MRTDGLLVQVITIVLLLYTTFAADVSEEELGVTLQFFEFELEDICTSKSEAEWRFLNGNETNLKQLLELELKEAELYKNESGGLHKANGREFSAKRLQRLFDIFFHPGPPLLGNAELKEYKEYSVKLQELRHTMGIECRDKLTSSSSSDDKLKVTEKNCKPKFKGEVNQMLATEKDESKLKAIWNEWFDELELQNRKTKFDFMQQLSILDIEAEYNEEDDLSDYWLKQADITDLDYHKISQLWKEIIPLYQKIRKYLAGLMEKRYGSNVFINRKLFPVYLLGSLKPENWIISAEKLGAFYNAEPYKFLASKLKEKNVETVYKMADNFTSDIKMGDLPVSFYNISRFHVESPLCESKMMDYCSRQNILRAISCSRDEMTLTRFAEIHEEVARAKHLMTAGREVQEDENGFLFREGPRDSVIYEAVASLSSLMAMRPNNLRRQSLLPPETIPNEEVFSLFLSALYIIPSLPYYLAADLWRINALKEMDATVGETIYDSSSTSTWSTTFSSTDDDQDYHAHDIEKREVSTLDCPNDLNQTKCAETNKTSKDVSNYTESTSMPNYDSVTPTPSAGPKIYDFENLTTDWWKYRESLQGIGNSDGKHYADFLQDKKIIWNKPYVSKFLGAILQFQLLEYFTQENSIAKAAKIQTLLQKGKSSPFLEILDELFNITEISTKPLLSYFKSLEDFIDAGGKFQNGSDSDDSNLFSDSYSMNSPPQDQVNEAQQSSNTIVFALLVLITLGLISITVFVVLKRYRRNQRAKERRKRLNEAIN